jgi:hypothetical protein
MNINSKSTTFIFSLSLLVSSVALNAYGYGGGHGGEHEGGWNGNNQIHGNDWHGGDEYHGAWYHGGTVIVPQGGTYIDPDCQTIQVCDSQGNCSVEQQCD